MDLCWLVFMGVAMTKKERTAGLTDGQLKDIIRTAKVVY